LGRCAGGLDAGMAAINETHAAPMRRFLNAIFLPALVGTRFEYMRAAPEDELVPWQIVRTRGAARAFARLC
jgi:hypothetical protein